MKLFVAFLVAVSVFSGCSASVDFPRFKHGWDSMMDMLSVDVGSYQSNFNRTAQADARWEFIAKTYPVFITNGWFERWNGTGEQPQHWVARKLKSINPSIRILYYEACGWVNMAAPFEADLKAHPEWWLRDDYGNPIMTGTAYNIDPTVETARQWFMGVPFRGLSNTSDHAALIDGILADGAGFRNVYPNMSDARYAKVFEGKLTMLKETQAMFTKLNGGLVVGNPLLQYGVIGQKVPSNQPNGADWQTSIVGGSFDEMFGSFSTLDSTKTGAWNVTRMAWSFEAIQNSTAQGYPSFVHSFPGPAYVPFTSVGRAGRYPSWEGPTARPTTVEGLKQAGADMLTQSLAPFLISASDISYWGYNWFYDAEEGAVPCPDDPESCGCPDDFYPDLSRPLGPPYGPAVRNGTIYTRSFQHADVYVDLRSREASKITWH